MKSKRPAPKRSLFASIRAIRGFFASFPVCLLTALRSGCPPWATHLSFPLDMRYRAGVRSRSCRPSGCLRQAVLVRIPPGCLTLRAAYAAYRATALLLGSQPAPAGMCSGFQFLSPLVFRGQNSAFNSPPPCSPCPRRSNSCTKNWPNGQVAKIGIGLMQ